MTCFVQNNTVSSTIKNNGGNGAILNGTVHLLLPLDMHKWGRRRFSPLQHLFPSLSQKPKTDKTHAYWPAKMEKQRRQSLTDGCIAVAQPPYPFDAIGHGKLLSPIFPL